MPFLINYPVAFLVVLLSAAGHEIANAMEKENKIPSTSTSTEAQDGLDNHENSANSNDKLVTQFQRMAQNFGISIPREEIQRIVCEPTPARFRPEPLRRALSPTTTQALKKAYALVQHLVEPIERDERSSRRQRFHDRAMELATQLDYDPNPAIILNDDAETGAETLPNSLKANYRFDLSPQPAKKYFEKVTLSMLLNMIYNRFVITLANAGNAATA